MPGENEPQRIPITRKNLSSSIAYKSGYSSDGFVTFDVGVNYKVLEAIGTGAYGVVCSAIDKKSNRHVAIKKIVNPFDIVTTAKRTLRELKLLLHFKHDNIVGIKDIIQTTSTFTLKDVYLVMDLMESDLHHIIRSDQQFTVEHIKYFLYQLLRGVKYIHSANVIHRDLKPSNLLVNENCELKIGDFGMARGVASSPGDHKLFMTEYVATRWYRAPELMLSVGDYCQSIDMWSIGCILAEMIGRKQIFPGKHYVHQLQLVISVLGSPEKNMVSSIRSDRVRNYIKSLPNKKAVPLKSLYPKASEEMLDILGSFLRFNPADRPNAAQCLSHPFLSGYHDSDDEPLCHTPFDFRFESTVTKEEVKDQVIEVVKAYHLKKSRFANQLFSVKKLDVNKTTTVTTKPTPVTTKNDEVFKKPAAPPPTIKPNTTSQNLLFKPETPCDVTMKSASSVCSMDLSVELAASEVQKNLAQERKKVEGSPPKVTEEVTRAPIITVQVVQSDEDSSDLDRKSGKKDSDKKAADGKKSQNSTKKVTISENTKMKIRDTIFASMFAKQKGLGKPLDKVRKSVTAAERQREREEKRKKRNERAAEKERKKKEEKGAKEELSEADRSMLDRWTKMQGSKNEPKPANIFVQENISQKTNTNRLNRHKSLPSNTPNPFKPVQVPLVEKIRPNSFTNEQPKQQAPQTVSNFGNNNNDRLITVVMPTKNLTLHKRVQSEGTYPVSLLGEKPNSQGFIPEPNFVNRPNKSRSFNSDEGQFLATGGGMFIPEITQPPMQSNFITKTTSPTSLPQRPKSIFTTGETSRKFTVFMPGHDPMTPGQATQQSNVLTTPMGNNLATLSPDTIDFVLNDEFRLRSDSFGEKSNPIANTLSHSYPKTVSNQFNHTTTPTRHLNYPNTQPSESKYSSAILSKYADSGAEKSEGGIFVPVADDSVNLNNHHYGPIGMLDTPTLAGANGGGYGLGLDLADIFPQSAGVNMDVTGDCSPSLLADWLDIRCLEPDDMDSLQRELELGSPMCVDNEKISD